MSLVSDDLLTDFIYLIEDAPHLGTIRDWCRDAANAHYSDALISHHGWIPESESSLRKFKIECDEWWDENDYRYSRFCVEIRPGKIECGTVKIDLRS